MILEFLTLEAAQACLTAIDNLAITFWQGLGYKILEDDPSGKKFLVGKKFGTDEDAFDKTKTETWSEILESPDGTFYISSLTGTRFEFKQDGSKVLDDLRAAGFVFTDKEFPIEWIPNPNLG